MMRLSQLAQLLNGRMEGNDVEFQAVSTDSRTLAAGDLFIALQGENFDGSQFVGKAGDSGAVAALVNQDRAGRIAERGSIPVVWVEDTRLALGRLAEHWRQQFNIPVIGVTGSNGKTTVKEMLAGILREAAGSADAVLATQGNLNNDIGMPLTLLKLRAVHQYAVIEMGMNHPGEIDYLTRLAHPDVVLINNAASAHLAGLGSVEGVARAKGEIFAGLGEQGVAVINGDDAFAPLWRELARPHRIVEFGLDHHPDVRAQWHAKNYGAHMSVTTPQGEFIADLQVPGAHNVRNALAATAAACAIKVALPAIRAGLEKFGGVAGRLQRKAALRGATLIDDTYNANPASLRAALKVLTQAKGKKLLVLGDMGELGPDAAHLHAEIGNEARSLGVDKLFALGDLSSYAVDEFGPGARHFDRIEDLFAALEQELNENSTVLVKGSRFMKMERVVRHCTSLQ